MSKTTYERLSLFSRRAAAVPEVIPQDGASLLQDFVDDAVVPKTALMSGSPGPCESPEVLSASESAKGFVRPVRNSYVHTRCGAVTSMGQGLAEAYARDPGIYPSVFCCYCAAHFPAGGFTWGGTDEKVGT